MTRLSLCWVRRVIIDCLYRNQVIPESPYLIEPLIDSFEEETSQVVRLELLAATCKLFFLRPAEMQHMLGRFR